jgi:hypothetical protein
MKTAFALFLLGALLVMLAGCAQLPRAERSGVTITAYVQGKPVIRLEEKGGMLFNLGENNRELRVQADDRHTSGSVSTIRTKRAEESILTMLIGAAAGWFAK